MASFMPDHPRLELRSLGAYELTLDGKLVVPQKQLRKADALLTYLTLNPNVRHPRSTLIDLFCATTRDPAADFRSILNRVRNILSKGEPTEPFFRVVNVHGDNALVFEPTPLMWTDAVAFLQPLQLPTLPQLIELAQLYRGPFLAGYEDLDCASWIETMRATLETQFDSVMKALLDSLYEQARWNDMLTWSEQWISHSPFNREPYIALMEAHSELGNLPKLDETYARFQRAMANIDRDLIDDYQQQYDYLRKRLVEGYSKVQLRVPNSDTPTARLPKPLPRVSTEFVGRRSDLQAVEQKLKEANCRLLTVMGIGGVGKTRLALQAATQLRQVETSLPIEQQIFPDGVCFVESVAIQSADTFASVLADGLNFTPYGQAPLMEQVGNYLREKRLLLIFDAFEHLLTEPRNQSLDGVLALHDLLNLAPGVKALVTSREWLGGQLEHRLPIEGLDYPTDPNDDRPIESYSAVQLFLRSARRLRVGFSLEDEHEGVLQICRQVEGLPLAIDLAAAHIESMSAMEIAQGIRTNLDLLSTRAESIDPRQRSVRATFEYTWDELTDEHQQVFAQLSLFSGGFTRDAAVAVTNAPGRLLNGLVSITLLRYDFKEGRYDLHDLLRQFGAQKLQSIVGIDRGALGQRMADYYLRYSHDHRHEFKTLEPEWSNFLSAIQIAHQQERWPIVIKFTETLNDAWFTRARFTDARQALALAQQAGLAIGDDTTTARALCDLGRACVEQAAYDEAILHLQRSLQLYTQQQNAKGIADTQFLLGWIAFEKGDMEQSRQLLSECQQLRSQLNDAAGIALAQHNLARIAFSEGQYQEAIRLDKLALEQEANLDQKTLSQVLCYLSFSYVCLNNLELAQSYCDRALVVANTMQDLGEIAVAQHANADLAIRKGDFETARKSAQQSLQILAVIGDRKAQANVIFGQCYCEKVAGQYPIALQHGQKSATLYRELGDRWSLVRPLLYIGDIYNAMEQVEFAQSSWHEALNIANEVNHPLVDLLKQRLNMP